MGDVSSARVVRGGQFGWSHSVVSPVRTPVLLKPSRAYSPLGHHQRTHLEFESHGGRKLGKVCTKMSLEHRTRPVLPTPSLDANGVSLEVDALGITIIAISRWVFELERCCSNKKTPGRGRWRVVTNLTSAVCSRRHFMASMFSCLSLRASLLSYVCSTSTSSSTSSPD